MAIQVGKAAPAFHLPSTSGEEVSLEDLRGKKVVLYFYPKDETPGCTQEACDFRDNLGRLRGAGAVVLGVSKDSIESHDRFREKHSLPFDLLSDDDNAVSKAYGAFGQKMLYGKASVGTIRTTVLIDEAGKIEKVWSPVKVPGHVDKVMAAVRGESSPPEKEKASPTAPKRTQKKSRAKRS